MKKICIVSPCYNEENNIEELYARVQKVCINLKNYIFTFLFIYNASTDGNVEKLRKLARNDKRVKIIINTRNFGHIRSPYYGILQSSGDATIYLASDLQDPPELISKFLEEWENGFKVVLAEKNYSNENKFIFGIRRIYYKLLNEISDVNLTSNTTGFGLYDKVVLDEVRKINDPYPYLRGIICEIGHEIKLIKFKQPQRIYGITKNNFFTLYDIGLLGVISHSLLPIRFITFIGILMVSITILSFIGTILYKTFFLNNISFYYPLILMMIFGLFGLLFVFIGLLGEYIGSIHTYLQNRPIVVEKERINF